MVAWPKETVPCILCPSMDPAFTATSLCFLQLPDPLVSPLRQAHLQKRSSLEQGGHGCGVTAPKGQHLLLKNTFEALSLTETWPEHLLHVCWGVAAGQLGNPHNCLPAPHHRITRPLQHKCIRNSRPNFSTLGCQQQCWELRVGKLGPLTVAVIL